MDSNSGLDELMEILEEYRKANRFSTITVQIRDHEYVHVKKTVTESTPIGKSNDERKNRDKRG